MESDPAPNLPDSISLNSIEKFHALSDTESHPNVVLVRNRFTGLVDVELAKEAWRICLERQIVHLWPVVRKGASWRFEKSDDEDQHQIIENSFFVVDARDWHDDPLKQKVARLTERGIPWLSLNSPPAFSFCCVRCEKANRTELVFSVHHALTDGLAAISFLATTISAKDFPPKKAYQGWTLTDTSNVANLDCFRGTT